MFSTVLIPSDLSPASERMLECASRLIPLGTRSLVLMHALGVRHLDAMVPGLSAFVEPRLSAQARVLERTGLPVDVVIASGVAHEEIRRVARERRASLVLLAPQGARLQSEFRIGSVTLETLHGSEVPVLLARTGSGCSGGAPGEVRALARRILHPTDFSDAAERAFSYVRALVERGVDAVSLVHIQERARPRGHLGSEFDQVDLGRLERLATDLKQAGAAYVDIELRHGVPVPEILGMAAAIADCLVVMGTRGRGLIPEVLLGSTSHAVARQAAAPVLLVPAQPVIDIPP